MAATRNFSRNFSRRPSSLLRDYFDKICEILDISGETLESLTTSMYSKNIIGRRTKNKVLKDMGYAGANLLLNHLQLKLDKDPSKARRIFKMLRRQEPLHSIAKTMDKKLNRSTQQSPVSGLLQDEGMQDSFSSPTDVIHDETQVISEANALQEKFEELILEILKCLKSVDVEALRVRINLRLSCEGECSKEINDVLKEIDDIHEPSNILNLLIRNRLIGYFNYRLLKDVFKNLICTEKVNTLIKAYEDAHDHFFQLTDLATLAKVFMKNPELAPTTHVGLPRFTIQINESWEGKSVFRWDELLKMHFRWPPYIHIALIKRGCIVIEYSVLPFFASTVYRDLQEAAVLSALKDQGVIAVDLSHQLVEMGKKKRKDTGLHFAAKSGDAQLMEILLKAMTHDDDEIDEDQDTHFCESVAIQNQQGDTPLHLAASSGSAKAVELLLNFGADVYEINDLQNTTLHCAAKFGNADVVELILKSEEADICEFIAICNLQGDIPLHLAAESGSIETVEVLLKYSADEMIDKANDCQGDTPLHLACESGHDEIVELLVESGADVLKRNFDGYSPLHLATLSGKVETVKLLLELGASNINETTDKGDSALHIAVISGIYNIEMVKLLINQGIDVNWKNKVNRRLIAAYFHAHDLYSTFFNKEGKSALSCLMTNIQDNPPTDSSMCRMFTDYLLTHSENEDDKSCDC